MRQTNPAEVSSYAGSVVAVISSLTLTQVGVIVGILTAFATLLLNVWYTRRKDRREALESAARLEAWRAACVSPIGNGVADGP